MFSTTITRPGGASPVGSKGWGEERKREGVSPDQKLGICKGPEVGNFEEVKGNEHV